MMFEASDAMSHEDYGHPATSVCFCRISSGHIHNPAWKSYLHFKASQDPEFL